MSSFYAELRVAGRVYVIRLCEWKLTQATDNRGRVIAKVRHGKVYITLDVPDDTFLEYWANAPFMPLPGCVVFFQTKGSAARETLSWEEGHCVGYGEEFEEGSSTTGSYVCHLVIAAPKLTMSPGGPPQPFVAPAPREHGTPPQEGFLNVPPLLPPPTVITPFEVPVAETMAEVAARLALKTLEAAVPVGLILALVFGTITPAQAPGLPHSPLLPPDRDKARLADLIAKHAAGTLTANEEAELIELLAKVKGLRVQKLSDLQAPRFFHEFNGHRINLHSCPVVIPASSSISEQRKLDYDQVKFRWNDGAHGYEARWHTRTPGAPATQGDTWVVSRTTSGTAQGQRKVQHILTGPDQWTSSHQWQSAVSANQNGTATATQQHLLNSGHWPAHK